MDQINLSQQSSINIANPYQVQQKGQIATSQAKRVEEKGSKEDKVSISEAGKKLSDENQKNKQNGLKELTEAELKEVKTLQARDTEVRAHEQAHLIAAGPHALGGAKFKTTKGPDGNSYATSGHVSVDISKEKNPEATVAKMRTVKKAALAPGNPSSADRSVASQAAMIEQQAQKEINQENLIGNDREPVERKTEKANSESTSYQNSDNSSVNDSGNSTAQFKQNYSNIGPNSSISVIA